MHIAGGVYRERIDAPSWDALYGSGGRAASAVASLSPGSTLHTYLASEYGTLVEALNAKTIQVKAYPSSQAISFSYFHALSRPHIYPQREEIKACKPLSIQADVVLRFGFLEGDAVVKARRCVYDPQTSHLPRRFHDNGSTAEELSLVLNETEALSMSGKTDIEDAAHQFMKSDGAHIVIIKAGPRGAFVFDQDGNAGIIPAYQSAWVRKIGTGDIFSAAFAWAWGEQDRSPIQAADLASRLVAVYCSSLSLPLSPSIPNHMVPVGINPPRPILLLGSTISLGGRYLLEEARHCLQMLGASVSCPALDGAPTRPSQNFGSVLILADTFAASEITENSALTHAAPTLVLSEFPENAKINQMGAPGVAKHGDFVTALYSAVWAAST